MVVLDTSTEITQLLAAAMLPPVYERVPLPATAVNVPPVQVVLALFGLAIVMPAGKLSVKSNALAGNELALLSMEKLNVTTSLISAVLGVNCLPKTAGLSTDNVALANPESPALEVKFPLVLMNCPEA